MVCLQKGNLGFPPLDGSNLVEKLKLLGGELAIGVEVSGKYMEPSPR